MRVTYIFIFYILFISGCKKESVVIDCEIQTLVKESNDALEQKIEPEFVYNYYKRVNQCNAFDGIIGTNFQEISNSLLAEQWLFLLGHKSLEDMSYRAILLRYISDGSSKENFEKICENSVVNCVNKNNFCKDVAERCNEIKNYVSGLPDKK